MHFFMLTNKHRFITGIWRTQPFLPSPAHEWHITLWTQQLRQTKCERLIWPRTSRLSKGDKQVIHYLQWSDISRDQPVVGVHMHGYHLMLDNQTTPRPIGCRIVECYRNILSIRPLRYSPLDISAFWWHIFLAPIGKNANAAYAYIIIAFYLRFCWYGTKIRCAKTA